MENLEYFEKFKNHIKVANGEIYKIPTPFCSEILEKIAIDNLKISDNLKNDFKKWSKQVRANFYAKTKDSILQEDKNLDNYGLYLAKELKNSLKNYYIEYKSKTHGIVAIKYLYLLADYSSCLFGDMDCFDIESLCEEFGLEYDDSKKNLEKKLDDWCYRCSKYQMKFENPIFSLSGSLYKEGLEFFCEIKKFLPINCVFEYKHVIGSDGDEFLFLSMANHRIDSKNDVLGSKQITLNLEQYIRNAIEVTPMTNNAQNLTNLYENASCFVYPSLKSNSALMVKFIKNNEKLIMATAHPIYRNIGFIYTGKIYRVYVWENGIEAQIGFTMENGRSLEFFDDDFLNKRASYAPNTPFRARIYAVAFWAKYSKNEDVEVEITPYNVRNFGGKIGEKKVFKTGYMRMCVCADGAGGDKDEFFIKGRVSKIKKVRLELFKKRAFICSIDFITNEFIQEDGGMFDEMETLIVKDVWKESKAPKVGDYIYARVYLGGEILY